MVTNVPKAMDVTAAVAVARLEKKAAMTEGVIAAE